MYEITDKERISTLETELKTLKEHINTITNSVYGLQLEETTYVLQARIVKECKELIELCPSKQRHYDNSKAAEKHKAKMRAQRKERNRIYNLCH